MVWMANLKMCFALSKMDLNILTHEIMPIDVDEC